MTKFRFTDSPPESKDKSQDPKEKKGGWGATIGNILAIATVCGVFYWVINSSTSSPSSPDDDFPDDVPDDSGGGDSGGGDSGGGDSGGGDSGCDCTNWGSRLQDKTDYSGNDINANGVLVDNINVCVNNCIDDKTCVRISYAPEPDVTPSPDGTKKGRCFKKKSPVAKPTAPLDKRFPAATAGPGWRQSINAREDDDGKPISFSGMYCDASSPYRYCPE